MNIYTLFGGGSLGFFCEGDSTGRPAYSVGSMSRDFFNSPKGRMAPANSYSYFFQKIFKYLSFSPFVLLLLCPPFPITLCLGSFGGVLVLFLSLAQLVVSLTQLCSARQLP